MEAAHAEQVAEAASTNTTTTPEFRVTCPVCRYTDTPIIPTINCFLSIYSKLISRMAIMVEAFLLTEHKLTYTP